MYDTWVLKPDIKSMASNPTALTGEELRKFVKANKGGNKRQMAREAGYYKMTTDSKTGDLKESVNVPAFLEALAAIGEPVTFTSARGRRAKAYQTTVHSIGNLLVGSTYIQEAGVGPGDMFAIEPDPKTGNIMLRLTQRVEGSPLPIKKPASRTSNKSVEDAAVAPSSGSTSTKQKVAAVAA